MRLTVSQYLARLTDRATQHVVGGCSAGRYLPDSWCIISRFMALRAAKRQSREWGATDRREGGTLGGVISQWVEKVRSKWVDWPQRAGGWMGGVSSESVKKGGARRRTQR